jgi:phosphocarrier protein HPr
MGLLSRKTEDTGDGKVVKVLTVLNRLGLHARPSAMLVKACSRFKCEIWVAKDGERVNGKSIMGLMMLAAGPGSKLEVSCEGSDASRAMEEIEAIVLRKFDED